MLLKKLGINHRNITMNTMQQINWQLFREQLLRQPELDLQFQYSGNLRVNPSYHITEIKQAPIVSVDCGGAMNNWTEIIIQLWEPAERNQERPMKVKKALSIMDVAEKKLPLNPDGMVKIEFGNSQFDTRQMLPGNITVEGESLIIDLRPDTVQCKATGRNETCGTGKPKVELKNLSGTGCCEPGAGCC